ncbi:MAG: protoporphyrinogen oxidase [Balneolaceae bacterium]
MNEKRKIAVVGAGISGLTTAYKLERSGAEVTLFEKRPDPGGSIKSVREKGWLVEYGPNTFQLKSERQLKFLRELGLEKEIVVANSSSSNRFVLKGGELIPVPVKLAEMFRTELISRKAKKQVLMEPFVSKGTDPDESLASFVRRRLGDELLEYAVDPFVAGVYAGRPDQLSVRHAFPRLYSLEQKYRSLILGAVASSFSRRRRESFATRLISFQDGLQALPVRIAGRLQDVRYQKDVSRIQREKEGWFVEASGEKSGPYEHVILNIPLYRISEQLVNGGGSILGMVKKAGYPPLSVFISGYRREQVAHPLNGFGFLVPGNQKRQILGTLFNSTLFPGRAPEGKVLMTTFVGGGRQPELASLETAQLAALVGGELRELAGVNGEPEFMDHVYWPNSIPQYTTSYDEVLGAIRELEEQNKGLHLLGNFRGGISMPDCIDNGFALAARLSSK